MKTEVEKVRSEPEYIDAVGHYRTLLARGVPEKVALAMTFDRFQERKWHREAKEARERREAEERATAQERDHTRRVRATIGDMVAAKGAR